MLYQFPTLKAADRAITHQWLVVQFLKHQCKKHAAFPDRFRALLREVREAEDRLDDLRTARLTMIMRGE